MNTTVEVNITEGEEFEETSSLPSQNRTAGLDNITFYIFTAGVFLLPIFFLPFLGVFFEFEKALFLSLLVITTFFLWLLTRLKTGSFAIPKSMLLVSGVLVLFSFLASTIFSQSFRISFSGFAYEIGTFVSILVLFLMFFLSSNLFNNSRKIFVLYGAFLLSFALMFLFHIFRLMFGADFLSFGIFNTNTSSVIGKWNDVSIFAGMITLLSFVTLELVKSLDKTYKILFTVALVLSLLMLAIVNLAISWFVLGAIALIVFVYNFSFSQFRNEDIVYGERRFPIPSFIVLLVSFLFVFQGNLIGGIITDYANITQIEVRPSWASTVDITFQTWKEDPLFGSGPNRFTNQWLAFKPSSINDTIFWNTDFRSGIGLIPSFATTTGIVGLIAWLLFFIFLLYYGMRSLFSAKDEMSHYLTFSSFILSIYLWVVSIVYVPGVVTFALAFLMTGVFVAVLVQRKIVKNINVVFAKDPRVGFVVVLALIVFLIGTASGGYTVLQKFFSFGYFRTSSLAFNNDGDVEKARNAMTRAISLNESDLYYRSLVDIEVARLSVILSQENLSVDDARTQFQTALGSAIDAGQKATQIDSTNYANWLSLGKVYRSVVPLNIPGTLENARSSFDRAISLNQQSPALVLEQARLEIVRGDTGEARKFVNRAIEIKNDYADAIFLLAQLDITDGNTSAAINSVERATLVDPNNAGLFFQLGLLKYSDGDNVGAASSLERAIAITPNYANAKYFLGLAYFNIDRNDDAVKQFESVLELNPDNSEVKQILLNLKEERDPFDNVVPPAEPPEDRGEAPIEE